MKRWVGLAAVAILATACQQGATSAANPHPTGPGPSPQESQGPSPPALPSTASSPEPQGQPEKEPGKDNRKGPGSPALMTRVVDGDTAEARLSGASIDVRLIGVDTPETVHPFEPVECFGPAASSFTRRSLEGERIRLEFDVQRRDQYGRTLAYVWLGDRLFNRVLVARGFAQVATYPPNVKYVEQFIRAQRSAREHDRGLWKACRGRAGSGGSGGGEGSSSQGEGGCDPSYPDTCIPRYPPDLDCADVPQNSFRVVGNDLHGFDGDDDGVGCE
jgi:micrococcal nuclease